MIDWTHAAIAKWPYFFKNYIFSTFFIFNLKKIKVITKGLKMGGKLESKSTLLYNYGVNIKKKFHTLPLPPVYSFEITGGRTSEG